MGTPAWTEDELDRRHDEVVARFPGGLTAAQFRQVTLETARDDDRVYPHAIADPFARYALLIGMWMDGLIEHRDGRHKPLRWFITAKGRDFLASGCPPMTRPVDNAGAR